MRKMKLEKGDVVQLGHANNKAFTGCFLIVTEPKEFGCQGFTQGLGATRDEIGGQAFYRANWEEMEYIGKAAFMPVEEE